MLYVLIAIFVFGLLILLHELGHFAVAKACHVTVLEFSVGIGPALWKKQRGETLYALRLLPLGGYCAMEGGDTSASESGEHSLYRQSLGKKLLIFLAGSAMNFLTGLVLVTLVFGDAQALTSATIAGFAPEFSHPEESLQVGDTLYAIDGKRVFLYDDVGMLLSRGNGKTYQLTVLRDGKKVELDHFPLTRKTCTSQQGETYEGVGLYFQVEEATFGRKVSYIWNNTLDFARLVLLGLEDLLIGNAGVEDLSGPVGVVDMMTQMGEQSETVTLAVKNILYLAALVAVNLAVMNLLPLPALDGGKILFLLIDAAAAALFKKHIPQKYEGYISIAGLLALMAMAVFITIQDISRLVA